MADKHYAQYKNVFSRHNGILRASTAIKLGVPKHALYKMLETGELIRETKGIYLLKNSELLGNPDLVQVSLRVPRAVICLISALYYYNMTTQIPQRVYFALPRDVKAPKIEYPPIRVFHFSEKSYQAGITEKDVDGFKVKIYNREKTIVDCFKFREKIGIKVVLEALKDYLKQPGLDIKSLMNFARVNKVEKVIQPYLEVLI